MNLEIRSPQRKVEVAWFSDLCNGDYEYLGVSDGIYRSSYEHCRNIVLRAEELGFRNILLPSSYQVGQDTLTFAGAIAPQTHKINLLTAIRCGEVHPPMLARALSTLDHILRGRLTINIISSDLPGTQASNEERYAKSKEVIEILKQGWTQEKISFHGKYYDFELDADPVKSYQQNGGPLLYFGGISEAARELCAQHCDVYLLWPETEARLQETMQDMVNRAKKYGRKIDFGLRIHLIVRETEEEAREFAKRLISRLDLQKGQELKHRSLDSQSLGVKRQDELRAQADSDLFIEEQIWSGIGLARSGCGSAIVGSAEQVLKKINRYIDMGFRAFIFSGYPLLREIEYVAKYILPHLPLTTFSIEQGRTPQEEPVTPLTTGVRK